MKNNSFHQYLNRAALAAAAASVTGPAAAQIQTQNLLINLDAADYSNNGTWNQNNSLGAPGIAGVFEAQGTTPRAQTVRGAPAVYFDESDYFRGPASTPGIDGANPTRSIEVWAYQGYARQEETLVAWGKRGGGDGTNMSFNYGNNSAWGAVGHWGAQDIGWGPPDGPNDSGVPSPLLPSTGSWHHLVYTYDGATQTTRIYVDGVETNHETGVAINTHAGLPIQIASQMNDDGVTATGDLRFGGAIGKVRIHDGVLTPENVLNNFNAEKGIFVRSDAEVAQPLSAAPVHRWSFNEAPGSTTFSSSVSDAVAELKGAGGAATGTGVTLPGGSSATQAYIDLPNGVASGKFGGGTGYQNGATYETWVTPTGNNNWSRIFDFGSSTVDNVVTEITGPGGGFEGVDYIMLSNNAGGDPHNQLERNQFTNPDDPNGSRVGVSRQIQNSNMLNTQQHLVVTYDEELQEWKWYRNGVLMEGFHDERGPDTLNDINNWLGRSLWSGDANFAGTYDEFRIYDYPLTSEQVIRNFLDGPNTLTIVPEPASGLLGLLGLGWLMRRKRPRS